MRLFRLFAVIRLLYPEAVFRIKTREKALYLTFDDGPCPGYTTRILDVLEAHKIKATFFCCGQEAEKYPDLMTLIISKGHIVGNHGYHHINGWKTNVSDYLKNVFRASDYTSSDLFRPPYGRISKLQYRELVKKYEIVFWDLMSYDIDTNLTAEKVLKVLKKKIRAGSVLVFHDKKDSSVLSFLEEFIKFAENGGYKFIALPVSGKKKRSTIDDANATVSIDN